ASWVSDASSARTRRSYGPVRTLAEASGRSHRGAARRGSGAALFCSLAMPQLALDGRAHEVGAVFVSSSTSLMRLKVPAVKRACMSSAHCRGRPIRPPVPRPFWFAIAPLSRMTKFCPFVIDKNEKGDSREIGSDRGNDQDHSACERSYARGNAVCDA